MALDALVDSTLLDADLTSVANAIRTKGGTSAQLAFPADFVSAIAAIPSGGADYPDYTSLIMRTASGAFSDDYLTSIGEGAFTRANGITSLFLKKVTSVGTQAFNAMQHLVTAVLPVCTVLGQQCFNSNNSLRSLDFLGGTSSGIGGQVFANCTLFDLMIIRATSICKLSNVNALSSTRFKSGGTGGTIYIPKALYDHLGDGSSSDYKAASNWSTYDGYGTITWAKIEGSQYENYYADGTPIT